MAKSPLFAGLVVDERGEPVEVSVVGDEAYYVIDDDGFQRHVESEIIDRQVLNHFRELVEGHESFVAEGTMKIIGQEDIFTKAAIETSLKNLEDRFDEILNQGLPDEVRMSLGMMGFQVVVDIHGEVQRVDQPGSEGGPDDDDPDF